MTKALASLPLDLRSMRLFVVLAEELHFGRAAERLFISQPPLTKAIQQLEARMGVRLLDRNKRSVRLTVAGETLLPEARRMLAQAEQTIRLVQRAEHGETGRIRIGFVAAILFMGIQDVFERVERALPGLQSVWEEMGSSEQLDALIQDRIDVGFAQVSGSVGELAARTVERVGMVVALPASHPLARQRRVRLANLAADSFVAIARESGPHFHDLTISSCMAAGFSPAVVHYARHLVSVVSLVAMGRGVALVPRPFSRTGPPGVVFKELAGTRIDAEYAVVWNPRNTLPILPRVLDLLETPGGRAGR